MAQGHIPEELLCLLKEALWVHGCNVLTWLGRAAQPRQAAQPRHGLSRKRSGSGQREQARLVASQFPGASSKSVTGRIENRASDGVASWGIPFLSCLVMNL